VNIIKAAQEIASKYNTSGCAEELDANVAGIAKILRSHSVPNKDSERINLIQCSLSSVQFNNRIMKWTVQGHMQVVGCLSVGSTIREAIDNATEATQTKEEEA
jgi:hypothetical protein